MGASYANPRLGMCYRKRRPWNALYGRHLMLAAVLLSIPRTSRPARATGGGAELRGAGRGLDNMKATEDIEEGMEDLSAPQWLMR
jgi:hypothetical protein